jgi:DNA polymerase III subunit epsilon
MFTFIDFETTGLDPAKDQVIEIAAIKTDLNRERGRLHLMVKLEPHRELPPFITELTGIKEIDLLGGMEYRAAMEMLRQFIGNDIVVAHHAPFELSFLAANGINAPLFACTRVMSRLAEPNEKANLKHVCERHGIALEGHHRAMNDVEATVEVFKIMRNKLGHPCLNTVIDSEERPLDYVPPTTLNIIKL